MADDISKRTVAILLVIAIIVSVIGTWTVMTGTEPVSKVSNASGNAVLKVEGGKPISSGTKTTGNAVLTINKK